MNPLKVIKAGSKRLLIDLSHSPAFSAPVLNERNEKLGFLGEEERPILANSEFLLTQEGFAGTSIKYTSACLPEAPLLLPLTLSLRLSQFVCLEGSSDPLFVRRDNEDESERRRRFRIDVLEKCGRSSALVESTAQFQCQPSWLSWVTGLMLRVEAIQRQERFGSRGHALSLPS
ncbi:Hypothetical predicted protein [Olea europaea subsp. europaea]|uniref:Uncharacterized protein n=1 Tax=Olea europaea subsp. europaea TaxID=158383 RepID=A0A8S0RJG6_OLEEU|nr:Hypothetical predicted protein [Olea europaea subsp. europaea]